MIDVTPSPGRKNWQKHSLLRVTRYLCNLPSNFTTPLAYQPMDTCSIYRPLRLRSSEKYYPDTMSIILSLLNIGWTRRIEQYKDSQVNISEALLSSQWVFVSVWSIFLVLTEYPNQMQEFTKRSVSDYSTECTHWARWIIADMYSSAHWIGGN